MAALLGISGVSLYRGLTTKTKNLRGQVFRSLCDSSTVSTFGNNNNNTDSDNDNDSNDNDNNNTNNNDNNNNNNNNNNNQLYCST